MVVVRKVIIVSVHVCYFSYFSFFSLGQSGYVSLHWRDGTWSSTIIFSIFLPQSNRQSRSSSRMSEHPVQSTWHQSIPPVIWPGIWPPRQAQCCQMKWPHEMDSLARWCTWCSTKHILEYIKRSFINYSKPDSNLRNPSYIWLLQRSKYIPRIDIKLFVIKYIHFQ